MNAFSEWNDNGVGLGSAVWGEHERARQRNVSSFFSETFPLFSKTISSRALYLYPQ
jgi:hypothetical protein